MRLLCFIRASFYVAVICAIDRFSLKKMKKHHWLKFWLLSVKRTVVLFMIGVCLDNPNSQLDTLRIMGPLQRLAVAYICLVTSICVISVFSEMCKCRSMYDVDAELLLTTSEINWVEHKSSWFRCREILPDVVKCVPYIFITIGRMLRASTRLSQLLLTSSPGFSCLHFSITCRG